MTLSNKRDNNAYGLSQALMDVMPAPIIAKRNPTTSDKARLGQQWLNTSTQGYYICAKVAANSATWVPATAGAADYVAAGTVVSGTTMTCGTGLTVTTGGITSTGTIANTGAITATTSIAASTTLASGTTLTVGTTAVIGTGLTVTTGGITSTGTIANTGAITATTTITAGTNLAATAGSVTAGTTVTATLGNITATNGDFVCTAATKGFRFNTTGPKIVSGAGSPDASVTAPQGSIYLRTDGAADTILYVNTDGTTAWTALTST